MFFLGDCPDYVDALPSEAACSLYRSAHHIAFDASSILSALERERFLEIRQPDGSRSGRLLHQLRRDGDSLWLFLCNGKNPDSPDVDPAPLLRFTLQGEYAITLYDTLTGTISPLPAQYGKGKTTFERPWHLHDSLLLRLDPGQGAAALPMTAAAQEQPGLCFGLIPVTLEEPNMLLLDMAEYALNGGAFYSEDELLRIDNTARRQLGIPLRRKEVVQPYLVAPETPRDRLTLRFRIPSEMAFQGLKLGLEQPQQAQVTLNGQAVPTIPDGWYVDRCIQTIPLPPFVAGENLLLIEVPIGRRTNLEAFYLLGDFSVTVNGTRKTLSTPVRALGWGDIVSQGLPFYTGNLRYHLKVRTEGERFTLRIPQYRGGLVKVFVDGKDVGNIAFSPYSLAVQTPAGEHQVDIRLYGTRQNGFAQLHHTQGVYFYQSPNSWRSAGDLWSYEYRFKPAGILKSPELYHAAFLDEIGRCRRDAAIQEHMTDLS